MQVPPVHLTIVQPAGYVHSLAFVDHARYFRHQFQRLGASVTMAKNRLRADAVNFVFGAHLGFAPASAQRHACVFVNLEQLGDGGAPVDPAYLQLLRHGAVVDYDARNVETYAQDPSDVPLVPFLHAPYLDTPGMPLPSRPIDLLFFGSMNARRREFIARVEAHGASVATFDHPLYGPERDQYIQLSKAVLNCHFYETGRFEQARVFQCLSLGTPVISERTPRTRPPLGFEDAVFWLDDRASVESFFRDRFDTPWFFEQAQAKLAAFQQHDPIEAYADLLSFAASFAHAYRGMRPRTPWRPQELNLMHDAGYRPGALNVAARELGQPDVLLDFEQPLKLPLQQTTAGGEDLLLEGSSLLRIHADAGVDGFGDLDGAMTNALALLTEGGELVVDASHAGGSGCDPWTRYTSEFWRAGWFAHRFEASASHEPEAQAADVPGAHAAAKRIVLRKVATSPHERTLARMHLADFGGLPADGELGEAGAAAMTATSGADANERPARSEPKTRTLDDVFASLLN